MRAHLISTLTAALMAVPALAQYGRVEDGRANDGSLRVGSGGRNLPRRQPYRSYSNQVITGNVGRGLHFRGDSPIESTTAFQGTLGSTTLDTFRRDAVSVDDVRRGYTSYGRRPYYSQTGTATITSGVRSGFQPSGVPRGSRTYINLPQDPYRRGDKTDRPYSRQIRIAESRSETPELDRTESRAFDIEPRTRSALFGIAPDPAETSLNPFAEDRSRREMRRIPVYSRTRAIGRDLEDPNAEPEEDGSLGTLTPPLRPRSEEAGSRTGSARREGDAGSSSRTPDEPPQRSSITRTYAERDALRREAQERKGDPLAASRTRQEGDLYRTMLQAASYTKDLDRPEAAESAETQGPKTAAAAAPEEGEEASQAPSAAAPPSAHGQEERLRELLSKPITTFSGTAKTFANDALRKAEEKLAKGRYYDAVAAYDVARMADPQNALAWIGRGHALIGAGDYLSAVASLDEGLGLFPEYSKFDVDLKAFLKHRDVLDIRRADLEGRLERKEDYRLRFLLGYIEYYSGLEKFGLPNLIRAAKDAPETSPISRFPEMLRAERVATRPAN